MTVARRSVGGEPGLSIPKLDPEQAMPTKQQGEQQAGEENQEGRQRDAVIGEHVLHALGRPGDLQRVEVRRLWKDHYRVNVFVGAGTGAVRVAHSYFLIVDGDGNVTESSPTLTRRY